MLLKDLKVNEEGVIKSFSCEEGVKTRLYNLGLKEGVKVRVVGFAPFNEPVEITFNGTFLALSKSVALNIRVE